MDNKGSGPMGPGIEKHSRPLARSIPHRRFLPDQKLEPKRPPLVRALYDGEPETCRRNPRRFLAIFAHLGILLLVFQQYRLEGRGFHLITQVAFFGFPIHYLLPHRYKQPFFLALSVAGLGWVFGFAASGWVVLGLALATAVCVLPIAWLGKVSTLGFLAAALLTLRSRDQLPFLPETVIPLLGSMLMFRAILLLYELKHAKKPESPLDILSYFCLLPNYCFLHFPVIDYRTMQRSYFSKDVHLTQQVGLRMIFRGTVHLLAYRLVYHELLITPGEVRNLATLVSYLTCNYLLYLHVSGQFHIACGLMHMFGYGLPETHHHYLLATGFTDYWRRINIYWKDFMVRIVFNPIAFRLKRRPQWQALAAATVAVFFATWFLHAYQSYWLRGTWGFTWPDALFWGILGILVLVNVQLDARAPRKKASNEAHTCRELAVRSIKIAGTFTTIAVLWSLWSSPTVSEWLAMMGRGLSLGS